MKSQLAGFSVVVIEAAAIIDLVLSIDTQHKAITKAAKRSVVGVFDPTTDPKAVKDHHASTCDWANREFAIKLTEQ
jgi:hypothetical protein